MNKVHTTLEKERWGEMPFVEQMANIGSEISPAIHWRHKNKENFSQNAFIRAHELIRMTIDSVSTSSRLKELTRLRETLNDYIYGNNEFSSSGLQWQKYFDHFNYAARIRQNRKL